MNIIKFQFALIMILIGIISSEAQNSQIIPAHSDDITIKNDNTSWGWIGQTTARLGHSNAQAYIIPFQLPVLQPGESITTADLAVQVISYSNQPSNTNIDLYGLPFRTTSTVDLNTDYFVGALDTSATLIQDNIFEDNVTGLVNLDSNTQQNLVSYLNAQYSAGAVGGDFVFIRFSADANSSETWNLASQDNGTTSNKPILDIAISNTSNTTPTLTFIGNQNVQEQSTLNVNISASDMDGDALSITSSTLPSFATLIDNGDGTAVMSLNPQLGDASTYSVTIIVSDGIEMVTETISIVVSTYQTPVAGVYYCDPINGNINNDGSQANPWSTLAAVVYTNKPLNSGDIIYLMSGDHGDPYINNMSFNDYVTVKALSGNAPVIKSIQLVNSSYWAFDGIKIDGTNNTKTKEQVLFSSDVNSHHTKIINSTISSAENIETWTKTDWYNNVTSGIQIRSDYAFLENNVIKNTYHALEVRGEFTEVHNNLIDNFAGDAIRGLGSNSTYENNTVRDCYINDYAIQHDDGFQAYNLQSDPKISNVTLRNNVFMLFADPVTPFVQSNNLIGDLMQGIIITDGYADGWIVENNIVSNNQDHGISLYGARNCKVQNNTVVQSPLYSDADHVPWIMLTDQTKTGQTNFNNVIRNNISAKYTTWTYDTTSTVEHNITIDGSNYANYSNYFVDYVTNDFHLSATSPAIDAGVDTDLAVTDLEGNPRSMGTSVDAGAYEYTGTVAPPANNAPILASIGGKTMNELETLEVSISATDSDNDTLTLSISNAPNFTTFLDNGDGTASLTLSPQIGDANSYNITVSVTDGMDSIEEIILVTINPEGTTPLNNAPIIANVTNQTVEEDNILNVNISVTDSDNDTLTITSTSLPNFATFTDHGDGTALFKFTPSEGDAGTYTIDVQASDTIDTTTLNFVVSVSEITNVTGTAYYCDPINGSMSNPGTLASPWKSLQDVFTAQKTFNSGDVIYLLSGAHGSPYMTGTHSDYVTIKPLSGEHPVLASVQVENGSYWAFDGLTFSTDGSGGNFVRDYMFLTKDDATYLKIENCTFSSANDSSTWSKNDWYANSEDAVIIRGDNIIFNNNTIKNVYFALQIEGDYAEIRNNLIDNFGADAIRALGSHAIYENNIIRDAYIEDYNINHDDGIQMYDKDNVAAGIIDDVVIRNNKIFNFADPITQAMVDDNLIGYSMQGIIITDGHTENVIVENNLVVSDHYHGITLTGAINCKIQNNTVSKTPTSYNPVTDAIPWIQIKNDKQGNGSTGNIIRNNIAAKYTPWTYDETTNTVEYNIVVSAIDAINTYEDFNNWDFNLKAGSSAIDAGVNTGLTTLDINGDPRSVGAAVDCGAFELQASADITSPVIVSANNTFFNDEFVIVFSESVTNISSELPGNYTLSGGATISSASLSADNKTVTLTCSALNGNTSYTITANNVEDYAGNTASNSSATFIYECDTNWASTYQDDQWGYNPPSNAFDGDNQTKWAAEGNQWIQKSFCEIVTVQSVDISFGLGDERAYSFVIEVSTDGRNFTQVHSDTSTGTTTAAEHFDFVDVSAKYFRIVGSGSDVNGWNNYSEIVINTSGYTPPTNTAPVLVPIGNQTITEGDTLNIIVSATDTDGDTLSFTANNLPSFVTFMDNNDNTATLTIAPAIGDASTNSISISVNDGTTIDTETLNIVVNNDSTTANNAPVLSTLVSQTLNVDEVKIINISATDADADALTFAINNAPSYATFVDNGDRTATITLSPISGDEGTSNITVTVYDGELNDSAILNIQVNALPQQNNYIVEAVMDDQTVYDNGGMQWVGYHTHRIGSNNKTSAIIPFQIPTLAQNERLTSATLNFHLLQNGGNLAHKVDLYGLPYRSSSTILSTDFYAGVYDTDLTATAIEDDILDLNSPQGNLQSSSSQNIVNYINNQLDNGAVTGDFIFFRFSLDYNGSGNYNYWDIASQDHTTSSYRPVLNFDTALTLGKAYNNNTKEILEIENSTVSVYPNPINEGKVTISSRMLNQKSTLEIYSLTGRLVFKQHVQPTQSNTMHADIQLNSGVYILKLRNTSKIFTQKLIVN
ncbi:choice-of-anchor Q domain-containing protein [Winogradskyella sp. SM1960]|uniref:choice-of-anchor Q domain-containing protein n=1 Tax=Winogradskyella sp. SM1960 TaxID=2865955 RepID=UPI001CD492F0|nr:Ig-like domain-containing protein [Winogradskyella sp. SM1960]